MTTLYTVMIPLAPSLVQKAGRGGLGTRLTNPCLHLTFTIVICMIFA